MRPRISQKYIPCMSQKANLWEGCKDRSPDGNRTHHGAHRIGRKIVKPTSGAMGEGREEIKWKGRDNKNDPRGPKDSLPSRIRS